MSKRTWQWVFPAIVIGTAALAWYQYKQAVYKEQESSKEGILFPGVSVQDIKEAYIYTPASPSKSDSANIIHLKNQNSVWKLQRPVQDIVNADIILDWFSTVLSEKTEELEPKTSPPNWSQYGLDHQTRQITLINKKQQVFKILISHYSAFDGRFFMKKIIEGGAKTPDDNTSQSTDQKSSSGKEPGETSSALLLGSPSWAQLTEKSADYFRSYKLLNIKNHPISLEYQSPDFKTSLNWKNYTWSFHPSQKSDFPLSQSELESYWSALSDIQLKKTNSVPNTAENRKDLRLVGTPVIQLTMYFDTSKTRESNNKTESHEEIKWSVQLFQKKQLYAIISTRNYIFTVNSGELKKLRLSPSKLRDHQKPFQLNYAQVKFIEINKLNQAMHLKKTNNKWEADKTAKEETDLKIDSENVDNILNRIAGMRAVKYFGSQKTFTPAHSIILRDKDKQTVLKLEFGRPFHIKTPKKAAVAKKRGKPQQLVYVTSNLGREVMGIELADFNKIFTEQLTLPEKSAKTIESQ